MKMNSFAMRYEEQKSLVSTRNQLSFKSRSSSSVHGSNRFATAFIPIKESYSYNHIEKKNTDKVNSVAESKS